jgi:hypothetical protein
MTCLAVCVAGPEECSHAGHGHHGTDTHTPVKRSRVVTRSQVVTRPPISPPKRSIGHVPRALVAWQAKEAVPSTNPKYPEYQW